MGPLYVVGFEGTMSNKLRAATIRLAHENPSLRPHLLPILASDAADLPDAMGKEGADREQHDIGILIGYIDRSGSIARKRKLRGELSEIRALLTPIMSIYKRKAWPKEMSRDLEQAEALYQALRALPDAERSVAEIHRVNDAIGGILFRMKRKLEKLRPW